MIFTTVNYLLTIFCYFEMLNFINVFINTMQVPKYTGSNI